MALRHSAFARLSINAAVLSVLLIICLGAPVAEGHGSQRQPLSLSQLKTLIQLKTPDSAIAGEIRERGLEFVPARDTLDTLRELGAGPQTLQAVDDLRPMLDEAKQVLPGILKSIYDALDQGNPHVVRPIISAELMNNSQRLDTICKPFTYRAHYIEAIMERPHRRFEVWVHVLFKPIDEHAYVLVFRGEGGTFLLDDVADPPPYWFAEDKERAAELVHQFISAAQAGRADVLTHLVTANMATAAFVTDPCWQLELAKFPFQVQPIDQIILTSYKGLKTKVEAGGPGTFLVERVNGEYKIVSAFSIRPSTYLASGRTCPKPNIHGVEDPDLETRTLERFHHGGPVEAAVQSSPRMDPTIAKAREVLNEMVAGQFARIEAKYDAAMNAALPAGKLGEFWKQLVGQYGGFNDVISESSQPIRTYQSVTLVCTFQRATLDARIDFNNSDGTIAGIHFLPHKEANP